MVIQQMHSSKDRYNQTLSYKWAYMQNTITIIIIYLSIYIYIFTLALGLSHARVEDSPWSILAGVSAETLPPCAAQSWWWTRRHWRRRRGIRWHPSWTARSVHRYTKSTAGNKSWHLLGFKIGSRLQKNKDETIELWCASVVGNRTVVWLTAACLLLFTPLY